MRWGDIVRRLGLALTVAGVLAIANGGPAGAHAELVSSTPADGQTVQRAPSQLLLHLSESVELGATRVTITDAVGHDVPAHSIELRTKPDADTEEPTTLVVTLPHLGTGQYRVSWTTLSSDDLHVTQGLMVFGVGAAVHASGLADEPRPSVPESALRWAALLGLGVALGCGTLLLLVGRGSPRSLRLAVERRLLTGAVCGAVAAVVCAALLPIAKAAEAPGATAATLRRLLLHESYGGWWWAHEAALVALAGLAWQVRARTGRSQPGVGVVAAGSALAATAAVTTVLMGHGGVRPARHLAMVAVESLHVLSALLWAGSVVAAALVLSLRLPGEPGLRGLRTGVLRRFGAIAAASVTVAAVTGLLLAGSRIATPDALLSSVYGRLLVVKLAIVALALALGLVNTLLLRPELLPRRLRPSTNHRLTRRTVGIEATVVAALLAATAVLASAPPATTQRWQPVTRSSGSMSGTADDLVETLRVQPNRVGPNFLTLEVFDTRRPAPARVESVLVTLRSPSGRGLERIATTNGDGTWVVPGQPLQPGTWSARAVVHRAGLRDAVATYRWSVPDPLGRDVTGWRGNAFGPVTRVLALALLALLVVAGAVAVGVRRQQATRLPAPASDIEEVNRELSGTNGTR